MTTTAILAAAGCGIGRRIAVSSMVPILETTVEAVYRDQDLETVRQGIPANLLLLRGLCESHPGNRDLWSLTVQLHFYYGMGFAEEVSPEQAALVYSKGLELGLRALERRGLYRAGIDLEAFARHLESTGKGDVPLLFWTTANWSSLIRGRLNDPAMLADLPLAEATLRRVLHLDPGYFEGMPHVMAGILEASKPVLMGGKPEVARRHFEEALEMSGRRLLIFQVLYAQYYFRQILDEDGFVAALGEVLEAPPDAAPEYRLLNEIARRRAETLMEQKDDWF